MARDATDGTVVSGIIRPLIQTGLRLGLSLTEVNRALGLGLQHDTQGRAANPTIRGVQRLMKALSTRGHDAITAAAGLSCNDGGLAGFLLLTAPNARQALECFQPYYPLISNYGGYRLAESGEGFTLSFDLPARRWSSDAGWLAETVLTSVVAMWREAFGRLALQRVCFEHRAPQRKSSHATFFACPVHFNAGANYLLFPHAVLERRPSMSNDAMFRYFAEHAQAAIASLGSPEQFSDQVRAAIFERIETGDTSARAVARELGMSERTLRRRLEQCGQTFRDLVDHTRMAAADRMLLDTDRTLSEVAYALGFSEPSAFSRFCRRHHGMSPRQYWGARRGMRT